jgi:CHASE3 domain sensor protein
MALDEISIGLSLGILFLLVALLLSFWNVLMVVH